MSGQIQNADQARSFVEAYYSAETTAGYVCRGDSGYAVEYSIDLVKPTLRKDLRTKAIAELASDAFDHLTMLKDFLHLYDALQMHIDKLNPSVVKNLEKLHFPYVSSIRRAVISLPFTASASLLATMKKIDDMINLEWLISPLRSKQDLEDFGYLIDWLEVHRNDDLRAIVMIFNGMMNNIRRDRTLEGFICLAEMVPNHTLTSAKSITEIMIGILKEKINASARQIRGMGVQEVVTAAASIENLGEEFKDTKEKLREQVKQRIVLESKFGELFVFYNLFSEHSSTLKYTPCCWKKIKEVGSFLIEHANTPEELWKIAGSLNQTRFESTSLQSEFIRLISEKIRKMIASQDSLGGLKEIQDVLFSISGYLRQEELKAELEFESSLIAKRIRELSSTQLCQADSLEKLLEFFEKFWIPAKAMVGTERIDMQATNDQTDVVQIEKVCSLEIDKAQSLDRLNKISETIRLVSKKLNTNSFNELLSKKIREKKNLIYMQEIRAARKLSGLKGLRKSVSEDLDLDSVDRLHLQNSIIARAKLLKKAFHEVVAEVRHCIGELAGIDKELLDKVPKDNVLRVFAENMPAFMQERNLSSLLGVKDFSDTAEVTSRLKQIEIQMQPEKIGLEYQHAIAKLSRVLKLVKEYTTHI